ncbi:hypothetical protein RB195_004395 [Necator americanus]|uniref:Uncharacterized protein n=1 Tax=Necator americanus TaxID=51031 RepID=A0ABR1BL24_NECAM
MQALLIVVFVTHVFLLIAGQNSEKKCKILNREEHFRQLSIFWRELRFNAALGREYQKVYLGPGGKMYGLMIYPEATRYGCWVKGIEKKSKCLVKGVCLFDKKAPDDFDIEKIGDKQKCRIGHDEDCDYVTPATCKYPLCYIKEK